MSLFFPVREECHQVLKSEGVLGIFPTSAKDLYRQHFFKILDFVISSINDRVDQPGYRILVCRENMQLKATKREDYTENLTVQDTYNDDFEASRLNAQLELLTTNFSSWESAPTMADIKAYTVSLSPAAEISCQRSAQH